MSSKNSKNVALRNGRILHVAGEGRQEEVDLSVIIHEIINAGTVPDRVEEYKKYHFSS